MTLRTLGGLELVASDYRQTKPLLLLAYLALEGAKSRQHLAELFWPGAADPLNALSVTLGRLRRAAPDSVEADHQRARCPLETDAQRFLETIESGRYQEAMALYGGPFLEGIRRTSWGIELEEWVLETREFLAARARQAILRRAEHEASLGRFDQAARQAETAFRLSGAPELDPDEIPQLLALMVAGQSPHAATLKRDAASLGVDVELSSEDARQHLLGSVAPQPTRPHNIPQASGRLVGRERELSELRRLLAQPDCRLLTLIGPGGNGKTRLALEAIDRWLLERPGDSLSYVSLEALTSPTSVAATIADALDLDLRGAAPALEQVIRHLEDRAVLLVLDSFEHLIAAAEQVASLLQRCGRLRVLVTSRERLNLQEEWIMNLEGLPFPTDANIGMERARSYDAVRLFVHRARRARSDFELSEKLVAPVIEVCRLVNGSPLALELAASWARVMPPADIADEIERNIDFLTARTRNVPARHRSIRAAFEHSWRLLGPEEQNALARLSVFRGGFRRDAAREVADTGLALLARLVDKSLLRGSPQGRYDRHPLLFYFMEEKLAEDAVAEREARAGHAEFFFTFLGEQLAGRFRADREAPLRAIEEELDNILAAWGWAVADHHVEKLVAAAEPLSIFFETRGRLPEGIELFDSALAETQFDQEGIRGHLMVNLAWLQQRLGEYSVAERNAQAGLALLHPETEREGVLRGLNTLGAVALRTSTAEIAKGYWQEALEVARALGEPREIARMLTNLGALARGTPEARDKLREAEQLYRELGDRVELIVALNNLGLMSRLAGELAEAQAVLEEGLELARKVGHHLAIPYLLSNLSSVSIQRGQYERARGFGREALELARLLGNRTLSSEIHSDLGMAELQLGNEAAAEAHAGQAVRLAWAVADTSNVLRGIGVLAGIRSQQGRHREAAELVGLVRNHDLALDESRKSAELLVTDLEEQLGAAPCAAALEHGAARSLAEVVSALDDGTSRA